MKTYWALIVGELRPVKGTIDVPIGKNIRENSEKMTVNPKDGQTATLTTLLSSNWEEKRRGLRCDQNWQNPSIAGAHGICRDTNSWRWKIRRCESIPRFARYIKKNSSTCARYTDQAAKWKRTFHYSGVTKPYEEFVVSAGLDSKNYKDPF